MSKLLIVIDMQKGFDCIEATRVVETLNKTSIKFDNICFAMFENRKNSLFETQLKWTGFQSRHDKALMDGVKIPENSQFIWHSTYTVYNDDLKEIIQKNDKPEIYIAGLFSNVCLIKTAMDMFDDGIVPYIVKDLSGSTLGDGVHDVAFGTMKMAIGSDRIITTQEIS